MAAAELGLSCHVYCPDPKSPAFAVSAARTVAAYDDEASLAAFAASVDVVTYEFENVPVETVGHLAERVAVYPGANSLAVAQDRVSEKELLTHLGIAVPAYAPVAAPSDIYSAIARTGRPAILKTRRFGYDGKGQVAVGHGDDPHGAWRAIGEVPAILEAHVPFEREISAIVARARDGTIRGFDVGENRHTSGILATTTVPAAVSDEIAAQALAIAARIADTLDHVGVLAVEMFVVTTRGETRLLVNEIAPRVHNSGHWTERRRRHLAVRAAHPRHRRLAARRSGAPRRRGDDQPDRRRRRPLARTRRRTRRPPSPLRQVRGAPRPQDGSRQPALPAGVERRLFLTGFAASGKERSRRWYRRLRPARGGIRYRPPQISRMLRLQVLVRDNNVDQALKALKKKMQREGLFREMKLRNYYEKPSERRAREKAEAVRRARKLARKRAQREGLIAAPKPRVAR